MGDNSVCNSAMETMSRERSVEAVFGEVHIKRYRVVVKGRKRVLDVGSI